MCITLNKFKTNGVVNVTAHEAYTTYHEIFKKREKDGKCIFCNKPKADCEEDAKPFVMPTIEEMIKQYKLQQDAKEKAETVFLQLMEQSIYKLMELQPFIGNVIQLLQVYPSYQIPTMGIAFNKGKQTFELLVNPLFLYSLKDTHRVGVLIHEIYHKTFGHVFRMYEHKFTEVKESSVENNSEEIQKQINKLMKEKMTLNIAMDLVVNQYIDPELLPNSDDDKKKDGNNGNGGDGKGEKKSGKGEKCDGQCSGQGYSSEHFWQTNGATEKELMEATEDLVKRSYTKMTNGYDKLPQQIKDMLNYIDNKIKKINYRGILLSAMKKSLPANNPESTWARKNKRYGYLAPGRKVGEQPKLHIFIDTSGSISVEEVNEFLGIVGEFLQVGAPKCKLSFFNTTTYLTKTFKKGDKLLPGDIQSGGTDLGHSLKMIADTNPNLSIILTDGYYSHVEVKEFVGQRQFPKTIFLISSGGTVDHPFKKYTWQKTIKIPKNEK